MKDFLYNKSDIIVVLIIIIISGSIIYNRSEALLFPNKIETVKNQPVEKEKLSPQLEQPAENKDEITVTFIINPNDDSYTICKNLENIGVIEKASTLYNYLIQKKVDTKLRDGSYTLTKNMDFDEIIKIFTK